MRALRLPLSPTAPAHTRDLPGHENLVDVLQEGLVLHLRISEQEAHGLALKTWGESGVRPKGEARFARRYQGLLVHSPQEEHRHGKVRFATLALLQVSCNQHGQSQCKLGGPYVKARRLQLNISNLSAFDTPWS